MTPESITEERLIGDFSRLGLCPGMNVLVHSSLKSLGHVLGGAGTVVEALLRAVGDGGTLLAPTITGRAEFNADNPPVFDAENTPCWTGAIPEALRKDPRSVRSLHPTHSVAVVGPAAKDLIYAHEISQTPCGPETPYLRLARSPYAGRVLFIGCGMENNTTFHGVEEITGVPYHMQRRWTEAVIVAGGERRTVTIRLHSWNGPRRNYKAVQSVLEEKSALKKGRVGNAECLLIDSNRMVDIVTGMLRLDPELLLAEEEKDKGWGSGKRLPED